MLLIRAQRSILWAPAFRPWQPKSPGSDGASPYHERRAVVHPAAGKDPAKTLLMFVTNPPALSGSFKRRLIRSRTLFLQRGLGLGVPVFHGGFATELHATLIVNSNTFHPDQVSDLDHVFHAFDTEIR
jgi:hypothetical protein